VVSTDEPRIGVYICHCGLNIAGTVDCEEVAKRAGGLPNVVLSKDYRYMCSDPGQEMIRKDIQEHGLNRVVVAACSPRMHEPTFRRCVAAAGLNPFFFEMANIRELCSWCHSHQPEEATEKALDLVKMAVAKARYLSPLEVIRVPVTRAALVIGGGVAGIHAALDLADMGFKVYLVERSPTIGGHMAQLDKTFPTLDCSICILGPKMVDVARHPNIELITYAEVKRVEGYIGNFRVTVVKKPRYVVERDCNGCGECAKVCPVEVPNEFDMGLGPRKAIYVPFPQAVPMVYTIDRGACIECMACAEACRLQGRNAIDLTMREEETQLEVGTIIIATGYDLYDATRIKAYGYGIYDNVFTALEFERMINASGPTMGQVIRLSDKRVPNSLAFITCVGSRDEKSNIWCSGFCCMYTLKNAILMREHYPNAKIYILYMDMRTPFKGYEEFYRRAREEGIIFIRGRPTEIYEDPKTKNLLISMENIATGEPMDLEVEMVVLSTGAVPPSGSEELARALTVSREISGFFMEAHAKLKPIDAATDGVFLCGAAHGPKDIPYSVSQGSAAASRAARIMARGEWEIEPIVAYVDPEKCRNTKARCGICTTKCPYGAITAEEGKAAVVNTAKCHGCGTCAADCPANAITQMHFTDAQIIAQIHAALEERPEEKILGFLCNWCSYGAADLAGTSRFQYPPEIRIIRVMCSGRVDRDFVLEAFRRGAGMVMVSGCRFGDCHYISGNYNAEKRIKPLFSLLPRLGISPERLRLEWFSAAEAGYYVNLVREMSKTLKELGAERIRLENEKARPLLDRMLSHLGGGMG
jgi:heterodisulfide reductase subunit A